MVDFFLICYDTLEYLHFDYGYLNIFDYFGIGSTYFNIKGNVWFGPSGSLVSLL